jgi:hypothetical protein
MPTLNPSELAAVDRLVNSSIDDARNSLIYYRATEGDTPASIETGLQMLRLALEKEKEGQNRSSLLNLLRSTIRANEAALEGIDDDLVAVAMADRPEGTKPEPIPPRPVAEDVTEEPANDEAPAVDPSPMVHLRYAPRSQFAHHPRLAMIPMSADVCAYLETKKDERAEGLAEDLAAFNDTVYTAGILEPIKVIPCPPLLVGEDDGVRWWVVDGRTRIQSLEADDEVPFVEINPDEVEAVIESTITGRRNWSKGQKAYLAVLRNPEIVTEARDRQRTGEPSALSAEGLANRFGVSPRLIEQATEVARAMESLRSVRPELVESQEMEIWAGTGLASVLSALKGAMATVGKPKPTAPPYVAAALGLKKVAKLAGQFSTWNQADMMAFRDEVATFWQEVGDEFAEFLTLVRDGDARKVEAIIAARELAQEGGREA